MEKRREDDVGAQKMNERIAWGVAMTQELAKEKGFELDKEIFLQGISVGISMFIQSERRK